MAGLERRAFLLGERGGDLLDWMCRRLPAVPITELRPTGRSRGDDVRLALVDLVEEDSPIASAHRVVFGLVAESPAIPQHPESSGSTS